MTERSRVVRFTPLLVLLLAGLAIYGRMLGHDFLPTWDDAGYVLDNPDIRGFTIANLRAVFSRFYMGNYAPVQMLSYMLDYSIWGLRPWGYLLTNLLLHLANGLLFYHLVQRLEGDDSWAWLAALIFLVHPVQVESVAWVSQRKNLLAMLFSLLSFHGYLRFRLAVGTVRMRQYLATAGWLLLALLAKSVAVVLPVIFLGYDLCYLPSRERRGWLVNKLPLLALAGGTAVLAMVSQSTSAGGGRTGYYGGGPWGTALTMLPVCARYLQLVLCPTGLSAMYQPTIRATIDGPVVAAFLLLLLLAGLGCWWYRSGRRHLAFWLAIFGIGLVPVSPCRWSRS